MKPAKGFIKVKCDEVKEIVTKSGIVIPVEQGREYAGAKTYSPQFYAPTHGFVDDAGENALGISIGDTVCFHFNTEETCKQHGRIEQYDGGRFLYIEADKVICYERDGILKPTEGWVLASRAEKAKEETTGGIYIPEAHRKESDTKFVVRGVADGYEDCAVGDIIYTEKDCDIPLQANEILGITEKDLFRINTQHIVGVYVE